MPALTLPPPDPTYNSYHLPDGTVIHKGRGQDALSPRWFVWLATKWGREGNSGRTVPVEGEIMLDEDGIRYFLSPGEALKAIEKARRGK